MIFKNAMSFKARIKAIAKDKGISTQQVQQNYLIEAFLNKLALSDYRNNFIVKGGYLIGSILGLDMRATMDLDTTTKGFELTPENLLDYAHKIVAIPTDESFVLTVDSVEEIREADDFPGYRLKIYADFERIHEVISIDATTGDIITPNEIDFNFRKIFSDEKIELLSYPLETVLSEKLEAILSRGIATTRPRDFYDVHVLSKMKSDQINLQTLKIALQNTQRKRQSVFELSNYNQILDEIRASEFQNQLWAKYQKQYQYAKNLTFDEVIASCKELMFKVESN